MNLDLNAWSDSVPEEELNNNNLRAMAAREEEERWKSATKTMVRRLDENNNTFQMTKLTLTYTKKRPMTFADIRRRDFKPFGKGIIYEKDLVTPNAPMALELGNLDPLEKQVRDDVLRMLSEIQPSQVKVTDPVLKAFVAERERRGTGAESPATPSSPKKAEPGETWGSRRAAVPTKAAPAATSSDDKKYDTIRLQNVSDEIKEEELRNIFGSKHQIKSVYIGKDEAGNRRGFAYITYFTEEAGRYIVEHFNSQQFRGVRFKNTVITVDFATNRKK